MFCFFEACLCFTVRDKVVPRPRPRRIYANFNGVELVIFQGSYRQQSLLVLYTERFNGNGGRCKQRNLQSD